MITPFASVFKIGTPLSLILFVQFYFSTKHSISNGVASSMAVLIIYVVIVLLGIVLANLDHRKKFDNKPYRFNEAVGCGVLTLAYASVIYAVLIFLYLYLNEDVGLALKNLDLKTKNLSAADLKEVPSYFKVCLLFSMGSFIYNLFLGLIGSIFIGFALKRK